MFFVADNLTVYEQAECFNEQNIPEHELKIRLNRFLFPGRSGINLVVN